MAKVPTVKRVEPHRIKSQDLKVGTVVEQREHPWASASTARKIAHDHLQENPKAYSNMGGSGGATDVNVTLAQNVKAIAPRKKKKVAPQPVDNGPRWIPRSLRFYG